jgi:hypothetical protein
MQCRQVSNRPVGEAIVQVSFALWFLTTVLNSLMHLCHSLTKAVPLTLPMPLLRPCRVHGLSCVLATGAKKLGLSTVSDTFFDTVTVKVWQALLSVPQTVCHVTSYDVHVGLILRGVQP